MVVSVVLLAGCATSFPDNTYWPNGIPVHPRMVHDEPPPALARASCIVGTNESLHAAVETWVQDPYGLDVEEWQWWLLNDLPDYTAALPDCVDWWTHNANLLTYQYSCGMGNHDYYGPRDENALLYFTTNYVCDQHGFAYYTTADFYPFSVTTDSSPPYGIPAVDPADPSPVAKIVCTPDPRDTRMCIEME